MYLKKMCPKKLIARVLNSTIPGLLLGSLFLVPNASSGEFVSYRIGGSAFEGYFAGADEAKGLVLIMHDWDGLTPYEEQRADMLASLGYDAFAVDLFGAGVRPTTVTDKRQHTGELYKDREKMRQLMQGALEKARSLSSSPGQAVAMGYCFGGAAVLEFARSGETLEGFASFHGGLSTPDGQNYANTKGKVLVYHGTADSAITMQQFAELAVHLETEAVNHEMTTYSAAPHGFTVFGSSRYQKRADEQSWSSFTDFLAATFAP
ncbi:MAG: dienelactone hydrolase family protein [Pseudomonadota bacterium]